MVPTGKFGAGAGAGAFGGKLLGAGGGGGRMAGLKADPSIATSIRSGVAGSGSPVVGAKGVPPPVGGAGAGASDWQETVSTTAKTRAMDNIMLSRF
ncbi:hypothetical protein ACFLW4_04385 [Chloroflexota bacterium]